MPEIAASIADFKRAGVVFEDCDFPRLKTIDDVCVLGAEKAAWFRDTEGNCLCLHDDIAQARLASGACSGDAGALAIQPSSGSTPAGTPYPA